MADYVEYDEDFEAEDEPDILELDKPENNDNNDNDTNDILNRPDIIDKLENEKNKNDGVNGKNERNEDNEGIEGNDNEDENDNDIDNDDDEEKKKYLKLKNDKFLRMLDDSDDDVETKEEKIQNRYKSKFYQLFNTRHAETAKSREYYEYNGEQKFEPFNLREERQEGYFDQFLNYHKKKEEVDVYYQLMDESIENKQFDANYKLPNNVIENHLKKYELEDKILNNKENNNDNNENDIDYLSYWQQLLPFFENYNENVEDVLKRLGNTLNKYKMTLKSLQEQANNLDTNIANTNDANINKTLTNNTDSNDVGNNHVDIHNNENDANNNDAIEENTSMESSLKKRKLNNNNAYNINNNNTNKNKKKKKKHARAWEISSEDEDDNHDDSRNIDKKNTNVNADNNIKYIEHQIKSIETSFNRLSEIATLLFANGDIFIYEQTRAALLQRVQAMKNVENNDNYTNQRIHRQNDEQLD